MTITSGSKLYKISKSANVNLIVHNDKFEIRERILNSDRFLAIKVKIQKSLEKLHSKVAKCDIVFDTISKNKKNQFICKLNIKGDSGLKFSTIKTHKDYLVALLHVQAVVMSFVDKESSRIKERLYTRVLLN